MQDDGLINTHLLSNCYHTSLINTHLLSNHYHTSPTASRMAWHSAHWSTDTDQTYLITANCLRLFLFMNISFRKWLNDFIIGHIHLVFHFYHHHNLRGMVSVYFCSIHYVGYVFRTTRERTSRRPSTWQNDTSTFLACWTSTVSKINVIQKFTTREHLVDMLLDMVNSVKPDERSVMAYVSSYYHAFSGAQQVKDSYKMHLNVFHTCKLAFCWTGWNSCQ